MPSRMAVGRSFRTPAKHELMNSLLGAEVGRLPNVNLKISGALVVDATAGDAGDVNSSPMLVWKHYSNTKLQTSALSIEAHLVEKKADTYEQLSTTMARRPLWLHLNHRDAREYVPTIYRKDRALFLIDDPNDSGTSTLSNEVIAWAYEGTGTTICVTIGANASGVARLPGHYEQSLARYMALLDAAERVRWSPREPVFCRLRSDPARWGYLIVGSAKFTTPVVKALERSMGVRYEEIQVGFSAVRRALTDQHTRAPKPMADPTEEFEW